MRRIIVATTVLVAFMATARADFQDGLAAYHRGGYATALREWRPLAEPGNASGQLRLGAMYRKGQGVPQNDVEAHMRFNLAAAQGSEKARKDRDIVAKKMSPTQIGEAHKLAQDWRPKKQCAVRPRRLSSKSRPT